MKKTRLKQILLLQLAIIIYTISGVMAKMASGSDTFVKLVMFVLMDFFFLGVYAIFWQQMIKIFPLSVAYANRAIALLWSAIWAKLIFGENISFRQIMAIGIVMIGMLIVNTQKGEEEYE